MRHTEQQLLARTLGSIAIHCAANKGTITRIIREMELLSGHRYHRQSVEKWLHRQERSRTEPRLGAGLLVLKAWDNLMNGKGRKK